MSQVLQEGSRKFDMDDNWKVYHPNGKHMFTTNHRRAQWYLKKNICKPYLDDRSIQFIETPNGEGFADDEIFGRTPRVNRCVVCNTKLNMTRHHVVPYHYRKFMPIDYKSRNHHDVVLICRKHHNEYEELAKAYKAYIAEKYGVKTIEELNNEYITNVVERLRKKCKIHKLLNTLLTQFNDLPIKNTEKLGEEIKSLTGVDVMNMTFDDVERLTHRFRKSIDREKGEVINIDEYVHGKNVIMKLKTHADFEEFIKGWRRHFIETMNPKFMPVGWSIDFRCKK